MTHKAWCAIKIKPSQSYEMGLTAQVQILVGKGMNPSLLSSVVIKSKGKLSSKAFLRQPMLEKENWIQTSCKQVSKVGNLSRGWPEGSLLNSSYTKVYGRALLLSLDCFTLPLILTL